MTSGFKIIGITTRTTNQDNKAVQDLGKLWERFFSENVFDKIPNKVSAEVYSIYTDYETDFRGPYTTFIGVPVSDLSDIPEGLTGREFPAEHFKKYTAKGIMPAAVVTSWVEIWQQDEQLNRKYSYDVEVYGDRSQLGENAEVDIFIAVEN